MLSGTREGSEDLDVRSSVRSVVEEEDGGVEDRRSDDESFRHPTRIKVVHEGGRTDEKPESGNGQLIRYIPVYIWNSRDRDLGLHT